MKDKTRKTNEQLIRQIFNRIFLLLTLLNLIAVIGYNIVQINRSESRAIMNAMTSQEKNELSGMAFQTLTGFDEATSFIRITEANGEKLMSTGTSDFLASRTLNIGSLSMGSHGIFNHVKTEKSGVVYELWLSETAIFANFALMLSFAIVISALIYLIGLLLIRRSSRRLSAPIQKLAQEAKAGQERLALPENPAEVYELAQAFNGLLEQLNQKVAQESQFASDASHELRTPVTTIAGHASLLKRRWHEHPELVDESLSYIESESERLQGLIEALLSLSRNEQVERKLEEVKIPDFVKLLLKRLSASIPQEIRIEGQGKVMLNTDPLALQEILTALIENASRYSAKDTEIVLRYDEEEIQVIDQGIGIPDEEKSKIFNRFYRVDKSRGEIIGNGLGLAIAEQYAEKNQMRLNVSDNENQGSIFHLKFSSESGSKNA